MRVNGSSRFLHNVGKFLPKYGTSHPTIRPSVHSTLSITRTFRSHENACSTDHLQNKPCFQHYVFLMWDVNNFLLTFFLIGDCKMRNFMICTPHKISFGWTNQEKRDGLGDVARKVGRERSIQGFGGEPEGKIFFKTPFIVSSVLNWTTNTCVVIINTGQLSLYHWLVESCSIERTPLILLLESTGQIGWCVAFESLQFPFF